MTRQWLAVPEQMCKEHVMEEHAKAHGFYSDMLEGKSLDGYARKSMFFGAEYVKFRHDLLAPLVGGHGSPLDINEDLALQYPLIVPTIEHVKTSVQDLFTRCVECYKGHMN